MLLQGLESELAQAAAAARAAAEGAASEAAEAAKREGGVRQELAAARTQLQVHPYPRTQASACKGTYSSLALIYLVWSGCFLSSPDRLPKHAIYGRAYACTTLRNTRQTSPSNQ